MARWAAGLPVAVFSLAGFSAAAALPGVPPGIVSASDLFVGATRFPAVLDEVERAAVGLATTGFAGPSVRAGVSARLLSGGERLNLSKSPVGCLSSKLGEASLRPAPG